MITQVTRYPSIIKTGNWKGRQADRRTEGKMDSFIVEHTDRQSDNLMEKWTDRQGNIWTKGQMVDGTNGQKDRWTEGPKD
jgi:hypothetical protein